ncbi:MAG: hypothetical protein ACOC32_01130 [Nanoarchaeota archaeon]
MRRHEERRIFWIVGAFFLIIQSITTITYLQAGQPQNLLWFCNHTPILLSIAFFLKKKDIIKTVLNVGLIPQAIWSIDFIIRLLFGIFPFGVTAYMFEHVHGWSFIGSVLAHVFSSILAFGLVYRYRQSRRTLIYSAVYLLILFSASLLFSASAENINMVRYLELGDIDFPGYTALWPILAFVLVVLPTFWLQRSISGRYHRRHSAFTRK